MDVREIRKNRLISGGLAIIENLQGIEPEELIFNLYLPIKDDETKKLIAFYEHHLVTAVLDKDKFMKQRYKQIRQICHWVRKNNKWQLFADFSMYVMRNINQNYNILCAYQNALMDTWANLAPYGHYWYGVDNGQPMFMKELYGAYDVPIYEIVQEINYLKKKRKFTPEIAKKYREKVLRHEKETEHIRINERNITNIIYAMLGMINSDNEDFIFPKEDWFDHYYVRTDVPRKYKDNQFYYDMLDRRNFFLSPEGVKIHCYNTGSLFKEIRLLEEFLEDGLLVLFRITNIEDKHTMGFIDLRDKFYYCLGKHAHGIFELDGKTQYDAGPGTIFSERIINFILEVYINLTCETYVQGKNSLVILKSPEEACKLPPTQPAIFCEIKDAVETEKHSGKGKPKALHKVRPFLRKGNASEMQRALARKYGIILPQGYTFVREHWRGKRK